MPEHDTIVALKQCCHSIQHLAKVRPVVASYAIDVLCHHIENHAAVINLNMVKDNATGWH